MKTHELTSRGLALGLSLLLAFTALPGALAEDTTVNVDNAAPAVASVSLPSATIDPTAGGATSVLTTVAVTDLNGYNDVASVTVEVLRPDGATTHVADSAATFDSGTGTSATYTYSFNMQYHDDPALNTDTYKVRVTVTDSQGASATNAGDLAVFNYAELAALGLDSSAVDFGESLEPASTSSVTSVAAENLGNVRIDAQVSGTSLSHSFESATIAASNVAYSQASNMSESAALSGTPTTISDFDLAKGSGSSAPLYWQLTVPSGDDQWVPSGTYTGTLTVSAVKG